VPGLRLGRDGGLLTVTIDRPAAGNALTSALLRELTEALRGPAREPEVAVVVLTGSYPAFCAGLDLKELAQDPQGLIATAMDPATNPFPALVEIPVPTIAAMNGAAYTGGLELVLACDVALASEQARFADTHAKVGVPPAQGDAGAAERSRRRSLRQAHVADGPAGRRRDGAAGGPGHRVGAAHDAARARPRARGGGRGL